jgi:hypothetical protein
MARSMYFDPISAALAAQMLLIGLAPWYDGRRRGFSGASRSWNGMAVSDSNACENTSSAVHATAILGSVRVFSGSTMPSFGRSAL